MKLYGEDPNTKGEVIGASRFEKYELSLTPPKLPLFFLRVSFTP